MRNLELIIVIFMIFSQLTIFVDGIACYECRSVSSSSDCISNPGTPQNCDKRYCTIYRREYLDPKGKIQNFYRSCENQPIYLNAVISTDEYLTYHRACTTDLCNIGDGIEEFEIPFQNQSGLPIEIVASLGSTGEKALSQRKLIVTLIGIVIIYNFYFMD